MDRKALTGRILRAFEIEKPPAPDQIAPHRCGECDELAQDLEGLIPSDVPKDRLSNHRWDLPLLSTSAKRYYLPAWMLASIEDPDSDVTDALLMNFDSDHRNDGYTPDQKTAILDYLRYIRDRAHDLDRHAVLSAEKRWS